MDSLLKVDATLNGSIILKTSRPPFNKHIQKTDNSIGTVFDLPQS